MASTFKIFNDGELLTASDVNNALNSHMADHLIRSAHVQVVSVTVTASRFGDAAISFPAGRFSTPPVVIAAVTAAAGDVSATARGWSTSATAGTVRVGIPTTGTTTVSVAVIAVQMTSSSATG